MLVNDVAVFKSPEFVAATPSKLMLPLIGAALSRAPQRAAVIIRPKLSLVSAPLTAFVSRFLPIGEKRETKGADFAGFRFQRRPMAWLRFVRMAKAANCVKNFCFPSGNLTILRHSRLPAVYYKRN